ncbi:hypothetical protein [Aminobacter sp. DSM 101952]|nr:hypothetical protein [Aminobacter sp. DSM 101952]
MQAAPGTMRHLSAEESQMIQRRRARSNWIILTILALFAGGVFALSFFHLAAEARPPQETVSPN